MAKKKFFFGMLAMVLALVFGLVLAGCGGGDDEENNGGGNTFKVTIKNDSSFPILAYAAMMGITRT